MPHSPVMRCSPVREIRGDNHRRGRSLEGGILLREKNDDLALFNEMETRERDSFLLPSNDDFEDTFTTMKLRYLSDYKLGMNHKTRKEDKSILVPMMMKKLLLMLIYDLAALKYWGP
ncbi:hypothetical protein CsSME_00037000 [Camellia sinensis var. sinensis]